MQYYPDPYWYAYAGYTLSVIISWIIFSVAWVVIGILCAWYVYNDAKRARGMPARRWALIAFVLGVIGLLIYLLMKNAKH